MERKNKAEGYFNFRFLREGRGRSRIVWGLCVLFVLFSLSQVTLGDDPNEFNQVTGVSSETSGPYGPDGSCGWEVAAERNGTQAEGSDGGQLTIEINTCQVFRYEIIRFPQIGGAGGTAELEPDDLIIVWDEDATHGESESQKNFSFTGTYEKLVETDYESYLLLTSTDSRTNWEVYLITEAGTFTKGSAGTNEHEILYLTYNLMEFWKDDNVLDTSCVSPGNEITYTICFNNDSGQTLEGAYIIDRLPEKVDYPQGVYTIEPGDPNDPNQPFSLVPPDPGYDPETHSYCWTLGDIGPNASGCVELTVVVNNGAAPGQYLHNVAELRGSNDTMVARAEKDTRVCCYIPTPEILFVDEKATSGTGSGMNWSDAFLDLQSALDYARSTICGQVQAIYVAQGVYCPGNSETDSFDLRELPGIALYGGFPTGGCDFSLRNPKRYPAILSGAIDPFLRNDTVVEMGDNCLIDGFTISEAGEYCVHGFVVDFSLTRCTIEDSDQYGIRTSNGHVDLSWCNIRDNLLDGIWHSGAGYALNIDNCWFMKQRRFGVFCENSVPCLKNSIVTESDLSETGNAGIRMVNPSSQPILQNCTISHNKAVGISLAGTGTPSLINSIVYHNNGSGPQLSANLNPDVVAQYCCIADCNEVNNNINVDPEFVYFDPNNVRIQSGGPCHDSGLTLSENYTQVDMDSRIRVLGAAVDRGAYEIECEDSSHELDWNHDGLVNMVEFNWLSRAWQSRDPNDPAIITDPNYIGHPDYADPNTLARWEAVWFAGGKAYDLDESLRVDLTDLAQFCDEHWLWRACWLDLEELQMQQTASGGGDEMLLMSGDLMALDGMQAFSEPVEPQLSDKEQIAQLEDSLAFLARLWLEEPDIQQQISREDWQEFMGAVYQSLLDLQTQTIQME